jgi:hypothetical protein
MKYRIVRWKWSKDIELNDEQYQQTNRCRKVGFNDWISLLAMHEWPHLTSINDKIYDNIIDAEIAFDKEIKRLGLSLWKEYQEQKFYEDLNKSKIEIEEFISNGKSVMFELKNSGYIYFLIKDNKVVYVGQTYTLATKRPYAHTDKSYDRIMVYEVKDKTQLNALESYLIYKLNPFYNNHPGQYGQDKLKHVLMMLEQDKNKIK